MKSKIERLGKVSITVEKDYWDKNKTYNRLTIVERQGTRTAYLSRKVVPIGVEITDRNYWITISKWADIPYEIVQEFGDSPELVISQKVVTLKVNELQEFINSINKIIGEGGSIDERISIAKSDVKSELINGASEEGDTLKKLEDRLSDVEESVGEGGSVDERIAEEGAKHYTKEETYNKTELNSLITTPNQKYVSVSATSQTTDITDVLPATGAADTIYRVGNWDGTQFDASVYSEYAWADNQYIHISTKTQIGDVFDISTYHATGGTLATYDDLEDALGTNGENIPQSLKKGGMSVKFVQTSDNKYVRFNYLLKDATTNNKFTNVANWQGNSDNELIVQNIPISAVNTLNNQYIASDGTLTNANGCKVVGPLNVLKGQTVVFETKISNSAVICTTDESMTSFTPVVIQPSTATATHKRYEYYAGEDCYIALSGRTSDFWFSVVKYFIPTFAYLDNKTNEIAKADNWYISSRADIVFNESSVKIGNGDLYFRKGNFTLNINHIETTYSFSGSSHLCLNLDTKTISIKSASEIEIGDVDLIYYDNQKGFCYGLLFDYYLNNKAKADNWYVASRANIVFNESSVKIGDGYLYFRKGNTASLNINHTETTYSFSGSSHLCLNLNTRTISVKSALETGDVDLIYYDNQKGFCYGLLFDYYLNNKINEIKTPEIVPSFVFEDGMEAYQRIINWANSDSIFLLGFITDVHSGGTTKYIHNNYLSALGEPLGFDILCNGGDIGLDTSATPDTHSRFEMMYNTKKGMIGNIPWIYVKGNHERLQSMAELGQIYNKSFNSIYGNFIFGDIYGLYGYRDYADKKIRIVFLNTSDNDIENHYSMSATQLQWLSNTLLNTPSNYGIVILTHRMIDSIGRWKSNMSAADGEPWDTYRSILKDFVARASGSGIDGVTWDFSTADAKLVCNLAGDSHFNSYVKRDGVNYIVRQGMQNAGSEMQGDATAASFDWKTKTCLDSLAIKKDGTAKIFRIGAGGSDYDLSFTY